MVDLSITPNVETNNSQSEDQNINAVKIQDDLNLLRGLRVTIGIEKNIIV